jgi:SAM-dependent methyltransferase
MRADLVQELAELDQDYWWLRGKKMLCSQTLGRFVSAPIRRLLDIGCGGGQWASEMTHLFGCRSFGTDSSTTAARAAAARGVACAVSEAVPSALRGGQFDVISALDVVEHLDDDAAALREFHRMLAPDGIVLIHVPAHPAFFSYWDKIHGHKRRYTKKSLSVLLRNAGFFISFISYVHILPLIPAAIVRMVRSVRYGNCEPPAGVTEHFRVPRKVNDLCVAFYRMECALRRVVTIPLGLSLVVVGRKLP